MKRLRLSFLIAVLLCMSANSLSAHDIEVRNADYKTIYYKWINNKTELAVTFRGPYTYSYSQEYQFHVNIPSEVYNGDFYSVTAIGDDAFWDCSDLTSVTIPTSVTAIGSSAFGKCSGLTMIKIPNSVTSIGGGAFVYSGITSIVIPNSVKIIAPNTFFDCKRLISVSIPNSVTEIGYDAFEGCNSLTSVILGNSVESIGHGAFWGCYSLTSIVLPNSVTSIGESAFESCNGLTSVTINKTVPIHLSNATFSNRRNATLYVPKGSVSAYKAADYWKEFKNILEIGEADINTYKLTYIVDGTEYKTYQIAEGATITPEPAPTKEGYTFSGWSEIPKTMPNHDVIVTGTFTINTQNDNLNYVDLGLPNGLLWATCNLGASSPEEVGNYYAWGETSPKTYFSENNYKYKDNPITLNDISGTVYDAATATLGDTWRMPTYSDLTELATNCTKVETVYNYKACMKITGPNGNYIFIPKGGFGDEGKGVDLNGYGLWSSTRIGLYAYRAWEWSSDFYSFKWQGLPIRPVKSKASNGILDIGVNKGVTDTSVYNLNGRRLDRPQRGLNIVRMSDGTTKKVVVK